MSYTNKFERNIDPKIAMGLGQEARRLIEFENKETYYLMLALEEIDEIRENYCNEDAVYDDSRFEDVPMELMEKYGFTEKVLELVLENTEDYEGWIHIYNGTVSIGGGA